MEKTNKFSNANIHTIFLDWNNTLCYSRFWSGMNGEKHEAFTKWLFMNNKDLINTWMRNHINSDDICKIISDKFEIPFDLLMKELEASCKRMEFCSEEIPSLLKSLKEKGYKLVLATDNMDTFRKYTFESNNIDSYFDDCLISCELGFIKEDLHENTLPFFEGYLKKNNLDYQDCLILDDSIKEDSNFHKVELNTIKITSVESLIQNLRLLL